MHIFSLTIPKAMHLKNINYNCEAARFVWYSMSNGIPFSAIQFMEQWIIRNGTSPAGGKSSEKFLCSMAARTRAFPFSTWCLPPTVGSSGLWDLVDGLDPHHNLKLFGGSGTCQQVLWKSVAHRFQEKPANKKVTVINIHIQTSFHQVPQGILCKVPRSSSQALPA